VHQRYHPSPDLAPYVEHFWSVHWNLESPQKAETLPHPSVHLVFEKEAATLDGVRKGMFARMLEGKGFVFAVKFRPASFYGFYGKALATLANKSVCPSEVFGPDFPALEAKVLSAPSPAEMLTYTEDYLRGRLPAEDENVNFLNQLLPRIASDRSITRVAQLLPLGGGTVRQLQRLFNQYVGVSPKWVIARYRIHEVLERVHENKVKDWVSLALDLGYADQAHFIRDFKALVGTTPLLYQKRGRQENLPRKKR
jgi:AraC-like DNA-binding protein